MRSDSLDPGLGEAWIPGSRWRLALITVASLGMTAASALATMITTAAWSHTVSSFGVFFFGLGSIVLAWRTIRPGGVKLTRDGFAAKALWGGFTRRWSDVESFQVVRIGRSSDYVGYQLKTGSGRQQLGGVARAVSGVDGMLPGQLAVKASDLVVLLERWRDRYTEGPSR